MTLIISDLLEFGLLKTGMYTTGYDYNNAVTECGPEKFYVADVETSKIRDNNLKQLNPELNIGFVRSAIRKIYLEELLQCPLGTEGSLHYDQSCEWAGVVYFDGVSIKGGTSLYFHNEQFEPDIMYAAKPNRAVIYKANTLHCANYDKAYKERIIQTIFF